MIRLLTDKCQHWLYEKAECRLCVDACPVVGCLSIVDNKLSLSVDDCVGCGICSNVCPSEALAVEKLTSLDLSKKLQAILSEGKAESQQTFVFGCSLGKDQCSDNRLLSKANKNDKEKLYDITESESVTYIILPCLSFLHESHLISLILSGLSRAYLDMTPCDVCSFLQGKKAIERTASYSSNFLNALGYPDRILASRSETGNKLPNLKVKAITVQPEYSRRELFLFLKEKLLKTDDISNQDTLPARRRILLESLNKSNFSESANIKEGDFRIHDIKINSRCNLCHECSLFCPTGALERVEGNGSVSIDFKMVRCMDCYQCAEICPRNALYYNDSINISSLLNENVEVLFKKETVACPSCGRIYVSDDDTRKCSICTKRDRLDLIIFDNSSLNLP
jgi:formate hydrogenlyase subunit 6/NADH:ubiquinone oxidoreductase subunit I